MATRSNSPPKPHLGFGTRIRKSPFFESTLAWGCKEYTTYNHMYFPVYYNTPEEDFWSLVNDVTLWDVSVERQVEIKGPDASKFTQLLTPRNLSNCEVNQCKYVLNTNYQGGILSDPILLRLAEDHWWYSISDSDLLLWAMGVAGKDKYDIELKEPDVYEYKNQDKLNQKFLDEIESYNKQDCRSTYELHKWLLKIKPSDTSWFVPQRKDSEMELRDWEVDMLTYQDKVKKSKIKDPKIKQ